MAAITKRVTRLSDGRELIYFDDADTALPAGRPADTRPPQSRPPVPELRQDPLNGDWVSIAAARQNRTFLPPAELDPLAPSARATPRRSPATTTSPCSRTGSRRSARGCRIAYPERARQLACRRHQPRPGTSGVRALRGHLLCPGATPARWRSAASPGVRTVVEAWADRTAALSALPGVEQVFPFENRGEAIGVTLHHPHGQIYAYPYITPRTARCSTRSSASTGRPHSDILEFERAVGAVCSRGDHCTAFVPFAARWPSRSTCCRAATCPTSPPPPRRARRARVVYLRLLRASTCCTDTPTPVHRGLAPGTRPPGPRRRAADAADHLPAPGGEQAQVPRRLGIGDGRVHRRHRARSHRGAAAGGARRSCRLTRDGDHPWTPGSSMT